LVNREFRKSYQKEFGKTGKELGTAVLEAAGAKFLVADEAGGAGVRLRKLAP